MSTEETAPEEGQPISSSAGKEQAKQQPATPAAKSKKPRNPIERAIVWLIILAIVGLGLFELRGKFGVKYSLRDLKAELKKIDKDMLVEANEDVSLLSEENMDKLMWFAPSENVEEDEEKKIKIITVNWPGLLDTYEFQVGVDLTDPDSPTVVLVNDQFHELDRFKGEVARRRNYFKRLKSGNFGKSPKRGGAGKGKKGKGKKRKNAVPKTKSKTVPTTKPKTKSKTVPTTKPKTKSKTVPTTKPKKKSKN